MRRVTIIEDPAAAYPGTPSRGRVDRTSESPELVDSRFENPDAR